MPEGYFYLYYFLLYYIISKILFLWHLLVISQSVLKLTSKYGNETNNSVDNICINITFTFMIEYKFESATGGS